MAKFMQLLKRIAALALMLMLLVVLLVWRAYDALRAPKLALWHTFVPKELSAAQIEKADWKGYLDAENKLLAQVRAEVTDKLDDEDRIESNRYISESPIYPGRLFLHGLAATVRCAASLDDGLRWATRNGDA